MSSRKSDRMVSKYKVEDEFPSQLSQSKMEFSSQSQFGRNDAISQEEWQVTFPGPQPGQALFGINDTDSYLDNHTSQMPLPECPPTKSTSETNDEFYPNFGAKRRRRSSDLEDETATGPSSSTGEERTPIKKSLFAEFYYNRAHTPIKKSISVFGSPNQSRYKSEPNHIYGCPGSEIIIPRDELILLR